MLRTRTSLRTGVVVLLLALLSGALAQQTLTATLDVINPKGLQGDHLYATAGLVGPQGKGDTAHMAYVGYSATIRDGKATIQLGTPDSGVLHDQPFCPERPDTSKLADAGKDIKVGPDGKLTGGRLPMLPAITAKGFLVQRFALSTSAKPGDLKALTGEVAISNIYRVPDKPLMQPTPDMRFAMLFYSAAATSVHTTCVGWKYDVDLHKGWNVLGVRAGPPGGEYGMAMRSLPSLAGLHLVAIPFRPVTAPQPNPQGKLGGGEPVPQDGGTGQAQ